MRALSEYSIPMLFVLGFGLVVGIALIVAASTSTTAFGAYNAAWDGTTDLRSLADTPDTTRHITSNTSTYTQVPPARTVALVLAPDQPYHRSDTTRITQFVRQGGTLVVADDRPTHANALLAAIGADARLDGVPLRDARHNYRGPAAPVVRNLSSHPLLTNVSALTLNHGTAVAPHNATVLARTSGYAYRDTNRNQNLDQSETVTQYPVMTIEQVGQGQVIVLGDPSLFINTMLSRSGNQRFVHALFTAHDHVLLDYSQTAALPPLRWVILLVRQHPVLQVLCGGIGVFLISIVRSRPTLLARLTHRLQLRHRPPQTTAPLTESDTPATGSTEAEPSPVANTDLVAHLRSRYPDWDDDRLQRIVAARRQQPTHDDHAASPTDQHAK